MRISCKENDSGYDSMCRDNNFIIFLDGERIKDCVTADDKGGFIIKYKTKENGDYIVNCGFVEYEKLTGQVVITKRTKANRKTFKE